MVSGKRKLVWDNVTKEYFKASIQYIRLDSPQNAAKVAHTILATAKELVEDPFRYPPDKYRIANNDNAYRAFDVFNFRISYFVSENEVRIVRLRHAKQDIEFY